MSKTEKLIRKLCNLDGSFTYTELTTLLRHLEYVEIKKGKTAGSRRAFFHEKSGHLIRLHQPHPGHELKRYQKVLIIEELQKENRI